MHYRLTVLLTILLGLSFIAPLEQSLSSPMAAWYFILKTLVQFMTLVPCLWGIGKGLAKGVGRSRAPLSPLEQVIELLIHVFLGTLITGVWTFAAGLLSVSPLLLIPVFGLGLTGFLKYGSEFTHTLQEAAQELKEFYSSLAPTKKGVFWLFLSLCFIKFFKVFTFQAHEDAYLYHLSLAETWIGLGHTGVNTDNIASGYALGVEHFYLFLKLWLGGNSEQNALSQMIQAVVGYGGFTLSFLFLARRWLSAYEGMVMLLLFLSPLMIYFGLLPKNDAFVFAIGGFALFSLSTKRWSFFYLICCSALLVKITSALALFLVSVFWFLTMTDRKLSHFKPLILGALGTCLSFLPFGLNNYFVTENPFFPLFNDIFRSPFGPALRESLVQEMAPFQITKDQLGQSLLQLIKDLWFPLTAAGSSLLLIKPRGQTVKDPLIWIGFGLGFFLSLCLFLGPYGQVESRHFMLSLVFLVIGLTSLFFIRSRGSSWTPLLKAGFVAIAISLTHADVSLRHMLQFFRHAHPTNQIVEQKPLLAINQYLSGLNQSKRPKVLALTTSNTAYFLTKGTFWHPSFSYPVWTWDSKDWSKSQWEEMLQKHQITYVITESPAPLAALPKGAKPVYQKGPYQVFQL